MRYHIYWTLHAQDNVPFKFWLRFNYTLNRFKISSKFLKEIIRTLANQLNKHSRQIARDRRLWPNMN